MWRYIDVKWKEFPGGDFCRCFWPKSPGLSIRKVLCWPFIAPWPVQSVTDIFPEVSIFSLLYIIALVEFKTSELNEGEKKKTWQQPSWNSGETELSLFIVPQLPFFLLDKSTSLASPLSSSRPVSFLPPSHWSSATYKISPSAPHHSTLLRGAHATFYN